MDAWEDVTPRDTWIGRCKRFNKRAGWGFIVLTKSAGDKEGSEVFVHYKNLVADGVQLKYLEQGEYVELGVELVSRNGEELKQLAALHVTGIDGGPLMCATERRQTHSWRSERDQRDTVKVYVSDRDRSKPSAIPEDKPWYVANV